MYRLRKANKYRNVSTIYNGIQYHSKFEASYAQELDIRLKAKEIQSWERQVKIPLDINGYHIANYYIDFRIDHNDGSEEFVEVKGFETDVWKIKWAIFEALYSEIPNVKLTVVKR